MPYPPDSTPAQNRATLREVVKNTKHSLRVRLNVIHATPADDGQSRMLVEELRSLSRVADSYADRIALESEKVLADVDAALLAQRVSS